MNAVGFRLGLGTGRLRDEKRCERIVDKGLSLGYRHIDTARHYENEQAIGRAIHQSEVPREDLFVATKIHSRDLDAQGVQRSVKESLDALGIEYLDLVYVHWPSHAYDPEETLGALSDLTAGGDIRHIGLSNFTLDGVREAREVTELPIYAVQVEMHPFLQQRVLREYAEAHGIRLVAHTPLCQGEILDDETLQEIADKYGVTPAQLTLAWLLEEEYIAAVPGASQGHLQENLEALSVDLREEDLRRITALDSGRRCVDYEFAPW